MSTKGKAGSKASELSGARRGRPTGPRYSGKDAVRMVCVINKPQICAILAAILMLRSFLSAESAKTVWLRRFDTAKTL